MKKFIFLLACMMAIWSANSQVIHVYPPSSIQAAINTASAGDTVLVHQGTYYEQINFRGLKNFTLASEYLLDGDTTHISRTIIDGRLVTNGDSGSLVTFKNGEDTTTLLCGFTITRGSRGTYHYDPVDTNWILCGGAIYISGAGAKITHNIIRWNSLITPGILSAAEGAGIFVAPEAGNLKCVIIDNNIISHNKIDRSDDLLVSGSAISVSSNAIITNNIINDNIINLTGLCYSYGGAVSCRVSQYLYADATIIFRGNEVGNNSSSAMYAYGAGVWFQSYSAQISHNYIHNNSIMANGNRGAGGIRITNARKGTFISDNKIIGNSTGNGPGGGLCILPEYWWPQHDTVQIPVERNYFIGNSGMQGGAFYSSRVPCIFTNNVFSNNVCNDRGGAVHFSNDSLAFPHMAVFVNNTFGYNTSNLTGAAVYMNHCKSLFMNSVFYGNVSIYSPGSEDIYDQPTDTVEIVNCDVDLDKVVGKIKDGGDIINEDPLFEDLDSLTISRNSPCFNAGIQMYTCRFGEVHYAPADDINGQPRPVDGQVDMGAHEWDFPAGTGDYRHSDASCRVWPNPAGNEVAFSYELEQPCQVKITLYDLSGRVVSVPAEGFRQKGLQTEYCNVSFLEKGLYFYEIKAGEKKFSGKLLKRE